MDEEIKNLEDNYNKEESRSNSLIFKWVIGLLVVFLFFVVGAFSYYFYQQKYLTPTANNVTNNSSQSETATEIDTSLDPVQVNLMEANMITLQGEKGEIYIDPMAEYSVSAKVMSATNYSSDWQSEFEPTDLALAWGNLAEPEYQKGITYTQSGRWYYYNYDSTFKADGTYVTEHSSNHHIIPANENIKKAVQKIKKGQKVKIDGYLVFVRYVTSNGEYTQTSSLTRADTGDGACEVVYVNKLQVEDKVYQ